MQSIWPVHDVLKKKVGQSGVNDPAFHNDSEHGEAYKIDISIVLPKSKCNRVSKLKERAMKKRDHNVLHAEIQMCTGG